MSTVSVRIVDGKFSMSLSDEGIDTITIKADIPPTSQQQAEMERIIREHEGPFMLAQISALRSEISHCAAYTKNGF